MSPIWFYIAVGVVVVVVGTLSRPRIPIGMQPESQAQIVRLRISEVICFIGVAIVGLGVYAGFKGPLELGPVTLPKFSKGITKYLPKPDSVQVAYAKKKMSIVATAQLNQKSQTYSRLRFLVRNKGAREVKNVVVQLQTKEGKNKTGGVKVTLIGPFIPGQKKTIYPAVPQNKLAMFKVTGTTPRFKIVSVQF